MAGGFRKRDVRLRGLVVGADWDEDDPTQIAILGDDEDEVLVADEGLGEDLRDYLREEVEVEGLLRERKDGRLEIVVESYKVLNWEEE